MNEQAYLKAPGPADKAAIRCFVCDCHRETQGALYLRIVADSEFVYMQIPLSNQALNMFAFDLMAEFQFPKPGIDGECDLANPTWWNDEG